MGKGRGAYRGNLREGDYWEDMVGEGRIMLKWGSVDCIDLAQDGDRWRPETKVVMNLRVLQLLD